MYGVKNYQFWKPLVKVPIVDGTTPSDPILENRFAPPQESRGYQH